MCAPATAALLLAALSALPSQGINANSSAKILNETSNSKKTETRPTINKMYLMLHSSNITTQNQTTFNNFHLELNINFPPSPKINNNIPFNNSNNYLISQINVNKGAKFDVNDIKRGYNSKRVIVRRKRVVNVQRIDREQTTKDNEVGTEATTGRSWVMAPTAMADRRRKSGESGSNAPLLNYIFDTYTNTHQHKNDRPGNGNSIYAAAAPGVNALVGSTAHLDCKVDALHDKLVSWVRRKDDDQPMELLTTGTQQYTADDRYSARFIPPDVWRLEIKNVRPSDEAHYDCQLSAHPPRTARISLTVPEVSVKIVDNAGAEVSEQVCEEGSTVALRCEVRGLRMEGGPALLWYRREDLLNDDTTRGGISVKTEFGANGANSMLRVARVRADDAGRYTCKVAHSPPVTLSPAYVLLHVIKGESLAELHQGTAPRPTLFASLFCTALAIILYI